MTTNYYDDFFFTTNSTGYQCPDIQFECNPTSACARDSTTGLSYCCSDANKWCWTASRKCETDGTTVDCGSGDNTWCCLDKTEICTTGQNQINICFNKTPTILLNISTEVLNETYSSLSSAAPAAHSFTFTPQALIAQTQTASTTTAAPSSTSPGSSSTPTTSPDSHASSSHLSGGAIAGIVIGCLAVLALVIAAAFYFIRKRKQPAVAAPPVAELSEAGPKQGSYYAPQYAVSPSELQGQNPTLELSTQANRPHELPGNP